MTITVIKPGLQSTLQSRARLGRRHLGIPAGGAADPLSLALANRLVDNPWDTPAIEATLAGPILRFDSDTTFAVAGARVAARVDGVPVACHRAITVKAGEQLDVGPAEIGVRAYVAVAGGIESNDVLGSASTELRAGFGGYKGRALRAGDVLEAGRAVASDVETPAEFRPAFSSAWGLRACRASETAWLDDNSRAMLFDTNWVVDRRADRMGLRLDGPRLTVTSDGRMPSAAVFPGTIQCPEDGRPYVLAADAGTVGGYPRIAQVARVDRHILGQLRPGDHVRLLERSPDECVSELREKIAYWQRWLPDIAEILR